MNSAERVIKLWKADQKELFALLSKILNSEEVTADQKVELMKETIKNLQKVN